jgi:Lar family restriction alleviation protein
MPVELLPCPHCGGEAVFRHDGSSGTDMVYVECLKCEYVRKYKQLEISAAKIWNQRATLFSICSLWPAAISLQTLEAKSAEETQTQWRSRPQSVAR